MIEYVKRFVPSVLEGNGTSDALYDVEAEEVEKVRGSVKQIFNNCFIMTMDLLGIQREESLLDIMPNAYQTLDQRREVVLNKLLYRPPFTMKNVQQILENIWGQGNFIWNFYPEDYRLIVDIDTNDPVIYLQFSKQVRNIIPANIYLILSVQYTYIYLGRNFTYEGLESLTYGELSQYSIIDT